MKIRQQKKQISLEGYQLKDISTHEISNSQKEIPNEKISNERFINEWKMSNSQKIPIEINIYERDIQFQLIPIEGTLARPMSIEDK